MYTRLSKLSKTQSFFLFGARGTGKSTLLTQRYSKKNAIWIDLLLPSTEEKYLLNPDLLREKYLANREVNLIIIDEIQKVPKLLDVVHSMIEEFNITFCLTGSSARKLKNQGANLLAGRAFNYALFPFSIFELGDDFSLSHALNFGMLPRLFKINDKEDKQDFLRSYVQKYIKEEIQLEQLVRDIAPFRKFLEVAAQSNAEILNYSKLGRSCGVDYKSVSRYFEILADTFLGFFLDAHSNSIRKRQISSPKFYLFDIGVIRSLTHQLTVEPQTGTYSYGKLFESFIIQECIKLNHYLKKDFQFSYLKTKDGAEIDLIIERPGQSTILLKIKSNKKVYPEDYRHLLHFEQVFSSPLLLVIYSGDDSRLVNGIHILNYKVALEKIFFDTI
jgi:predicted AAA+ superfamily ATPase